MKVWHITMRPLNASNHPGVRVIVATGALLAIGRVMWPRPTFAACGALDLGACVDAAQYSFYYGLAGIGWSIDRTLLQLAYQFDQFRTYLVTTAFTTAYRVLTDALTPAYTPIATVALILACLLFMLVPVTGRLNVVHIRHILIWVVLTPVLLTVGGQLIGQAEQIRAQIGSALFAEAADSAPGAIFGTTASDMPAPEPLYPSNPCGTGTLARPDGTTMHMDDLAAALLYANAQDIHCPDYGGPSPDIPDAFYATPPGYAFDGYVGNLDSEVERTAAIEGIQRGVNRLFQGVLPCALAVAESLLNLLFSLSLLVLWLGVPLGLLFVYFHHTASSVTGLFRRAVSVIQVSWASSIVMGLLFACLLAAAELGNATAYTGFAIGALLLTLYLCVVAGKTLLDSVLTLNTAVQSATGLSVTEPVEVAAVATVATAAVASGGATMAVAGLAASERTHNNRYALATMAGRVPGMAQLGEVAATMGWLDTDGPTYSGLHAGERSLYSWRSMRLQVERDVARLTDQGSSRRTASARTTPAMHAGVAAPMEPAELVEQLSPQAQHLVLAVDLAQARQDPTLRASALHLDAQQQVVYTERVSYPALQALHSITVPRGEADIARLLLDGYHVQENPTEGTVSYWQPASKMRAQDTPAAAQAAASHRTAADERATPRGQAHVEASALAEPSAQPRGQAPAISTSAAAEHVRFEADAPLPLSEDALTPVPQSLARLQRLLARLDDDIARAEQALAAAGQAGVGDAAAPQDVGPLEHNVRRLRRARSTVAWRVESLEAWSADTPEEASV
jgi:hypothetical protein